MKYTNKTITEIELYKYCPNCKSDLVIKKEDNEVIKTCNACGFVFWNNPKPVVSILLHQNGKVLMLKRANEPLKDYWVLPGGFIGHNETPQKAIKRETKEEIRADIIIDGLVGVYRIDNDPRGIHIDIIFYGKVNGEIKLNKENNNWQNFSIENLPKNIAYKHREREAITDWHHDREH